MAKENKNMSNKNLKPLLNLLNSDISNICPTKFIYDKPDYSNFDEQNGHIRIAKNIIELINEDNDGIVIGLEGDWGSGKSTIINLIRDFYKNSEKKDELFFWIFDAWAHENDPLRRVFLENLILGLQNKTWLETNNNEIKKLKNKISGKLQTQHVEKKFKLSLPNILLIFSLPLTPFGFIFVNKEYENISCWWNCNPSLEINKLFLLGLIIITFPFAITFITFIYNFFIKDFVLQKTFNNWNKLKNNNNTKCFNFFYCLFGVDHDFKDIINLFFNKELEIDYKEYIIDKEPTSIEFESYFKEILEKSKIIYKKQPAKHKLVIVLDNLDRVDPENALSILSTLQTFLQFSQRNDIEYKKFKNVKIIIPYAYNSMIKLWSNNINKEENLSNVSKMLDKRFNIIFKVPPLLMTDWKSFFKKQLAFAFPNHTSEEFNSIYDDYYRFLKNGPYKINNKDYKVNFPPSPRQLIYIINEIGIYHKEWCDKKNPSSQGISLETISNYVITQRYFKDISIPKILLDKNYQIEILKIFEKINIHDYSSLWFNVPKAKSIQLMLEEIISKEYKNSSSIEMAEYIKKLSTEDSNIWDILSLFFKNRKFINEKSFNFELELIYELRNEIKIIEKKETQNELLLKIKMNILHYQKNTFNCLNKDIALKYLEIFYLFQDSDSRFQIIDSLIKYSLERIFYQVEAIPELVNGLIILLDKYYEYLPSEGKKNNSQLKYKVFLNENGYISFLENLPNRDNKKYWDLLEFENINIPATLKTNENRIIITETIEKKPLQNNKINLNLIQAFQEKISIEKIINILFEKEESIDWNNFIISIRNYTIKNNDIQIQKKYPEILHSILQKTTINESSYLIPKEKAFTNIKQFKNHDEFELMTWYLYHYLKSNNDLLNIAINDQEILKQIINNVPQIQNKIISNFILNVIKFNDLDFIFSIEMTPLFIKLIRDCIVHIINNLNEISIFDTNDFLITYYDDLIFDLPLKQQINFTKIILKTNIEFQLLENENTMISKHLLLSKIFLSGGSDNLKERTIDNLNRLSLDDWEKELMAYIQKESSTIDIVLALLNNKSCKINNINYSNALLNLAEKIQKRTLKIPSNEISIQLKDNFNQLTKAIENDSMNSFKNTLLINLGEGSAISSVSDDIFFYFGDSMDGELLSSRRNIINELFIPIIKYKKYHGIKWIENLLEKQGKSIFPKNDLEVNIIPLKGQIKSTLDDEQNNHSFDSKNSLENIQTIIDSIYPPLQ